MPPTIPSFIFPPQAYNGKVRFEVWKTQLEMYLTACKVTDGADKALALLQHIGVDMLAKIIDWCAPDQPQTKSYDKLIKLLEEQFAVPPNLFSLRVKLFNEKQPVGQSVQEYISNMSQLLGQCAMKDMKPEEYGVLAILRGLESDELRQYLMNPANDLKTIKGLRDLAVSYEQSRVAAKEVACRSDNSFSLNFAGKSTKCNYCGGAHQRGRDSCPAKDKICKNCGKKDHFASVCKSEKLNSVENRDAGGYKMNGLYPKSVLTVSSEHEDYIPPYIIRAKLNGIDVDFQHDSGAAVTVISKKVWNRIGKPKLHASELKLKSYNNMIPVIGKSKIFVKLGKQIKPLWVTVVPQGASLFGRSWMKAFQMGLYGQYNQRCKQLPAKSCMQKLNTVAVDRSSAKLRECDASSNWRKGKNVTDKVHAPMQGKVKDYCKQSEFGLLSLGFPKSSSTVFKNFKAQVNGNYDRRCKDRVESNSKKLISVDGRVRLNCKSRRCQSKKLQEQSEDHSLGEGVMDSLK